MRARLILALFTVASVAIAASASGEDTTPLSGAEVYAYTCDRCHPFRSPVEFTDARWAVIATHMRVVAGIPADETRAVLEYLRANNNPPPAAKAARVALPVPGDPVASGKALVLQRGCVGCHAIEGLGGTMGPALDGVTKRRDDSFILTQLRDSRQNKPDSLMPNLGLSEPEIAAILDYLKTLRER